MVRWRHPLSKCTIASIHPNNIQTCSEEVASTCGYRLTNRSMEFLITNEKLSQRATRLSQFKVLEIQLFGHFFEITIKNSHGFYFPE